MSRCSEEKLLLDIFASMHLICIEKPETSSERVSRHLLEKWGYIDAARFRLGGKYAKTITSKKDLLDFMEAYDKNIQENK